MAKPKEKGFSYFPQNTDIFFDPKIRVLISKFGCDGYCVWEYIKQAAYRENGYYVVWDEERQDLAAADLNISAEKTGLIVAYLLRRSMLQGKSLNGITVLTSHGIQKRFQEMAKSAKRDYYEFHSEVWILGEEETLRLVFCAKNADNSGIKADNSGIKADNSGIMRQKKRKVNKSTDVLRPSVQRAGAREAEKFFALYPALRPSAKDGTDGQFEGIDFSSLASAFARSRKFLMTRKSWKWVRENYDRILAGEFDDNNTSSGQNEAVVAADARAERERWYALRRNEAEGKAEKYRALLMAIPEYAVAEKEARELEIKIAQAEINAPDALEGLLERQKQLSREKLRVAQENAMDVKLCVPAWHCQKCSDTGFMPDGRACDCYSRERKDECI